MRININLASNPYEAAREYARRMGILVAVLAVVTLGLVGFILQQRRHTSSVDRQIAAARQELASLDAEKAKAQAILNQPQNRDVADQSAFLNNLFARKALSWTRVFTEMEKLMPPNIHVISMKPEFNRDNQLVLHVVVTTPAREKAVELVKRMETSPHFRSPQVETENAVGEGTANPAGGNIQFEIAAVYVPFADETEATPDGAPAKTGEVPAKTNEVPAKKPAAKNPAAVASRAANPGGGR